MGYSFVVTGDREKHQRWIISVSPRERGHGPFRNEFAMDALMFGVAEIMCMSCEHHARFYFRQQMFRGFVGENIVPFFEKGKLVRWSLEEGNRPVKRKANPFLCLLVSEWNNWHRTVDTTGNGITRSVWSMCPIDWDRVRSDSVLFQLEHTTGNDRLRTPSS